MNRLALFLVFAATMLASAANSDESMIYPFTRELKVDAKQRIGHRWRPRETRVFTEHLSTALQAETHSRYGGWIKFQSEGTGFFRTEQDRTGRWWLIDPDGHPFLSVGVNSVRANNTEQGRSQLVDIWGDREKWAEHTRVLLEENGFNSLAGWSDIEAFRGKETLIPHTIVLNFMARYSTRTGQSKQGTGHRDYPDDLIPVFDPEFERFCHEDARRILERKDDPWIVGYFSDNEMPFPPDALDRFLRRPENDPGHSAARQWLAEREIQTGDLTDTVRAEFLHFMADRYFRIAGEAIRRVAPNHLYLGSRFHARVLWSEPVIRAAGRHVDVLSFNWYAQWTPDRETMDNWTAWANRPFLISEFFAKAMDTGLANTSGAGWIVKTQEDRAAFYQNFVMRLVQHPGCVGWHWFRYLDNDPRDTEPDPTNLDANKGIVDIRFRPYTTILEAMRLLNLRAYQLRMSGPALNGDRTQNE